MLRKIRKLPGNSVVSLHNYIETPLSKRSPVHNIWSIRIQKCIVRPKRATKTFQTYEKKHLVLVEEKKSENTQEYLKIKNSCVRKHDASEQGDSSNGIF